MQIPLNCIYEEKPGKKWQENFNKTWPFYKEWFLIEGHFARKGYMESASKLKHFMPELYPLYNELNALSGGGDLEARFLSMYCPPPYMTGCSQLAWTKDTIALIRNYDYNPHLFEGVMFNTHWLKPVIGIADCNWGLLDGMNADGLTASLAFGGRQVVGEGFGIPLIIRYILETCSSVNEAVEKLKTIPAHMSYNITLVDSNYNFATVYLSPDREIIITKDPIAVNHQQKVEWKQYAEITATKERKKFLETELANPYHTDATILSTFFQPPLYCNNFAKNFATLYTTVYKPLEKTVAIHWPEKSIFQSFTNFVEQKSITDISTTVNS